MRMAAPARTACWRMTLQANASSSGCGAITINLERISNVKAVKVRGDTLLKEEKVRQCNLIQLLGGLLDSIGLKWRSTACAQKTTRSCPVDVCTKVWMPCERKRAFPSYRSPSSIPVTVPTSRAMILYEAGMTIWNSDCFPSVDDCNNTPATRNLFPIGK